MAWPLLCRPVRLRLLSSGRPNTVRSDYYCSYTYVFGSLLQVYIDYRKDWRGAGRGERKGVPRCHPSDLLLVLADGHLVMSPH
jgi:hypothetical protein